jgi:hypothetical protein
VNSRSSEAIKRILEEQLARPQYRAQFLARIAARWSRQPQVPGLIAQLRYWNRVAADDGLRFRETGFSRPETAGPKLPPGRKRSPRRPKCLRRSPPNCGPLATLREIPRFERVRGGPGRIRTSNQTVMSGQLYWLSNLPDHLILHRSRLETSFRRDRLTACRSAEPSSTGRRRRLPRNEHNEITGSRSTRETSSLCQGGGDRRIFSDLSIRETAFLNIDPLALSLRHLYGAGPYRGQWPRLFREGRR